MQSTWLSSNRDLRTALVAASEQPDYGETTIERYDNDQILIVFMSLQRTRSMTCSVLELQITVHSKCVSCMLFGSFITVVLSSMVCRELIRNAQQLDR